MVLKKEDIVLVAQLLQAMKELSEKLEEDYKNKDLAEIKKVKYEMLQIQKRINEVI
jgi:hypothetical protein